MRRVVSYSDSTSDVVEELEISILANTSTNSGSYREAGRPAVSSLNFATVREHRGCDVAKLYHAGLMSAVCHLRRQSISS